MKTVPMQVRIDPKLRDKAKKLADKQYLTLTQYIAKLIRQAK